MVVLLVPEGFTNSKLPARPDVGLKNLCYLYESLLLVPSTTVHCQEGFLLLISVIDRECYWILHCLGNNFNNGILTIEV